MAFTLDDRTPWVQYSVVASSTGPFTIPFEFFDNNDIVVITDDGTTVTQYDDETGFTVTQTISSDNIGYEEGGTVDLDTAVANTTVTIYRDSVIDRLNQHPTSGAFNITSLNTSLSRIFAILQEQRWELDRTLRLAASDPTSSLEFPSATERAEKFLWFDASGNPSVKSAISESVVAVDPILFDFLTSTTLALARTELGVAQYDGTTLTVADDGKIADVSGDEYIVWNATDSTLDFHVGGSAQQSFGVTSVGADIFRATDGVITNLTHVGAGAATNDISLAFTFDNDAVTPEQINFARITGFSTNITDGAEEGDLQFYVQVGGAITSLLHLDGSANQLVLGGSTPKVAVSGAGSSGIIAQVAYATSTTSGSGSTAMPDDNTIPQNTEGDEVVTVSITPVNASSTLMIEASVNAGQSTNDEFIIAALFVDTTANAISAQSANVGGSGHENVNIPLFHAVSAGSTSARTYKLRVGSPTSTYYWNRKAAGDILSTAGPVSWIKVTEVLP